MTQSPKRQVPAGYRLRVEGHLDDHWSAWFGDLTLARESDGTTSLSGVVSDQAALHGLLMKVRDLGITLISVEAIDPTDKRARSGSGDAIPGGGKPVEYATGARDGATARSQGFANGTPAPSLSDGSVGFPPLDG